MVMATTKREMPKWTKAPAEMVSLFERVVQDLPGSETRKMFGYPAAFVSGQMYCSLFQDRMMIRLSERDRGAFLERFQAKAFEPIPGRPMREYVEVPEALVNNVSMLKGWVLKAKEYAATLPVKDSKSRTGRGKAAK
jgi:TfoX/Sxy family transcriptional regulator of competence genes